MKKNLLRDYDSESRDTSDHKYVYNFDFDIMHHYMIESFREYIISGSILELGSFEGEFTKRLIPFSKDITCVEASKDAVEIAKKKFGEDIIIYNSLFEDFESKVKYDNIILTHVLEHIDDRISLLNKIKQEWVSENGKIFIVCPNANALSRQIAKEMGLIKNVTDITDSEKKHGHTITYTLEKLQEEVESTKLKIKYKGGIFLKALANFQWDEVISKNIVNKDYLDGCFELGKKYPDLCSSIIIVCEK
jgi:2-polyprenyl-3-methyl-5-hydroxy-6-metoxy-1,4-benzoquinol methylase